MRKKIYFLIRNQISLLSKEGKKEVILLADLLLHIFKISESNPFVNIKLLAPFAQNDFHNFLFIFAQNLKIDFVAGIIFLNHF